MSNDENSIQPSTRREWKYAKWAAEFNARHGFRYAPDYLTMLEREMRDSTLTAHQRFMAGMKRFAWGNLSDVAVDCMPKVDRDDPEPRPLTQAKFGELTGLSPGAVSEAATFYRTEGYLRADHPNLYLEHQLAISPSQRSSSESINIFRSSIHDVRGNAAPSRRPQDGTASPDVVKNISPFLRFKAAYIEGHPEYAAKVRRMEADKAAAEEAARPFVEAAKRIHATIKHLELTTILPLWNKEKTKALLVRADGTADSPEPREDQTPAVTSDSSDSHSVNPEGTLASDASGESFTTSAQNIRDLLMEVHDVPTPEPPKPSVIRTVLQPLLRVLIPEGTLEESGRSVPSSNAGHQDRLTTPRVSLDYLKQAMLNRQFVLDLDHCAGILDVLVPATISRIQQYLRYVDGKAETYRATRRRYKKEWLIRHAKDVAANLANLDAHKATLSAEERRAAEFHQAALDRLDAENAESARVDGQWDAMTEEEHDRRIKDEERFLKAAMSTEAWSNLPPQARRERCISRARQGLRAELAQETKDKAQC